MIIRRMTEEDAKLLTTWRYDPPYDRFGWPAWTRMEEEQLEFADSELRERQYASIANKETGTLEGFVQFFPLLGVTRLGIGLRPDLCGQGRGAKLIRIALQEAVSRYPMDDIDLEVHTWNVRAVRAYIRAGFTIEDTYIIVGRDGAEEVHCMVYTARRSSSSIHSTEPVGRTTDSVRTHSFVSKSE